MKHHQPQLCERVSTLHRSGCGAKKSLQKNFSSPSTAFKKLDSLLEPADQSLGSLSDLLLALQDELGQMSLWVNFFIAMFVFVLMFNNLVFCLFVFFIFVSFLVSEQQELVRHIDATQDREQKQDLQRELERLVTRLEEKGAQITKLRKHQQTVCVLPLRTTPSDWWL